MEQILKLLDLKKEETIAFGHQENDLEMIDFANCSIAVCNAIENDKNSAKYITDSNDDDDVAKALLKIFH